MTDFPPSLCSTRDLAVLVSYIQSSEVEQAQSSVQPKSYAIVILEVLSSSSLPAVSHVVKAKHREVSLYSFARS